MHVTINNYLKRWGLTPYGEPLVRLVWSDSARELRRGEFNEYYAGIFLRTIIGVKEVLKYSWIREKWVLERWFPPEVTLNPELPTSCTGSHEPIYVFQNDKGEALPLSLRVVELICQAMFNQPPDKAQIRDGLAQEIEKRDKNELTALEDGLEMSVISNQLHSGEAIIVP